MPCRPYATALLLAAALLVRASGAAGFSFDDVSEKARLLATQPFQPPEKVPAWMTEITYDQWRDIRFRPELTLWAKEGLPFQVQFFHPGLYYDHTVAVNVVEDKGARPLEFSPNQFDYGRNTFASRVPQKLGYAGFRLHAPIKTPKYYDEVIVFLGASYFRAVGKDQVFGLSARGLAIETASPKGEEFPYFREFWLVTPGPKAKELELYAVLDSPSLTGAYRFVVEPGEQTAVHADARLFLRREVDKLGIAPLTSMFFHGENTRRELDDDFRPEAHDSDGLLLYHGADEWLWRPLDNPRTLGVRGYRVTSLKGFGLLQRDRDFNSYQDLETRYELRPSTWIAPHGDWGGGRVELVEIPTKSDTNDNIVAYWVSERKPKVGERYEFGYTIYWYGTDPARPPSGYTTATRRDRGNKEDVQRVVVDFGGKRLQAIPGDEVLRGDVRIVADEDVGELLDQQLVRNPITGGWRLSFQVRPKGKKPIELRAFLDKGGDKLTETWSYEIVP